MVEYKDTLNLPKTDFEMRAGLAQKEPRLLAKWQEQDLYGQILEARANSKRYVLHDGPPYANGHLHHGHILNKILKDIVVKDRTMSGFRTAFIPGWDCHGLPIEVQVDKKLGKKKADMSKAEVRKACREYAAEFVDIQKEEFKRLGIQGRWEDPYRTMSNGYEAQILRELARFAGNGLLYKGLRPVNWCTNHQTALAEAEVEYDDHTSPSVYVAFALTGDTSRLGLDEEADLVIWTTTPWTLPANQAICLHAGLHYVAYRINGRLRIFARGLADAFLAAVGEPEFDEARVVATWSGADLEGLQYRHPLFDRTSPVIIGEHVTLEAGTGCVHTAPGHGADDFDVGRRYGLKVLSPVDGRGVFTEEAGPFAGQHVFKANPLIIEALVEKGALLNPADDKLSHRYAHCWRCNKPIILRATEQWWVAVDKPFADGGSLRERALKAVEETDWIPSWGENRIRGMLEARPDWCLSRQRTWGVPIAVVYCEGCEHPVVDADLMNRVADIFEKESSDAWFIRSVEELLGSLSCEKCAGTTFRKEEDILDVWFDSGVSFAAVIEREGEGHPDGPPVDLYLEGSDQHRGWFHTSLLCGLATRGMAPYRKVLTHGFVVDGKGKKISKSKGNFVDPFKAIKQNGAEILRLWVASEDYRDDIRISDEIIKRLTDLYRKVRNTTRYLLGSLHGFDPNEDLLEATELLDLDRYALVMAQRAVDRMAGAYRGASFHIVVQTLNELCTVDMSAFYLDILKDRLYCHGATSRERRSAQTALYLVARDLLRLMAPVLSFTAEEAWGHLPRLAGDPDSVHLALYPGHDEPEAVRVLRSAVMADADALTGRYEKVRQVRDVANAALEQARRDKDIGSSTEAQVSLKLSVELAEGLSGFDSRELADLLIVSAVEIESTSESEPSVVVARAAGMKCARCWLYRDDIGNSQDHPEVCGRCAEAL